MNPYLGMLRESERHLRDIAALLAALCNEINELNENVIHLAQVTKCKDSYKDDLRKAKRYIEMIIEDYGD